MSDKNVVAKLSQKTGADPKKVNGLPEGQNSMVLCDIGGICTGLKVGESRDGSSVWTALVGTFEGWFYESGNVNGTYKTYRSGKLFLPGGIQETVEAAIAQLPKDKDGDPVGSVTFKMRISAVKANNPIGYSYEALNLLPVEAGDELTKLMQANEVPALPPTQQPQALIPPPPAPGKVVEPEAPAQKGKGKK